MDESVGCLISIEHQSEGGLVGVMTCCRFLLQLPTGLFVLISFPWMSTAWSIVLKR